MRSVVVLAVAIAAVLGADPAASREPRKAHRDHRRVVILDEAGRPLPVESAPGGYDLFVRNQDGRIKATISRGPDGKPWLYDENGHTLSPVGDKTRCRQP